jgi:hypothetical protein
MELFASDEAPSEILEPMAKDIDLMLADARRKSEETAEAGQ